MPYGAPPPGAGYGGPPPGAPYGAPPHQHQINGGHPPAGGPYGAPPAGPYGGGAPAGPYGAPAGGPRQQPPANPYGAPPQQHGGANPYGGGGGGGHDAPAPNYRPAGGGAIVRNEAPAQILDIDSLNPYQNRWTVKARVTNKSDIRRYTNARGEGKFFSFDLLDAKGGEIRVVGWNDQCDRFFDQVTQGTVYMLSRASLKNKRGNFNQTRHQYEIHLENGSLLEPVLDDAGDIPQIRYNFAPIAAIEDFPQGSIADVVGVVETVQDWGIITRKDGTEVKKRAVTIRDNSGRSIELTLWGNYVEQPGTQLQQAVQGGYHPILAVKGARVGDFNGKTLSTVASSHVAVDPVDIQEAGQLRSWYDSVGAHEAVHALSNARAGGGGRSDRRISLSQVNTEQLGMGQPAWVQILGHVTYIRSENFAYPACPLPNNETGKPCNKKMMPQGDGEPMFCERCGKSAQPEYRYILSMQVADHTDNHWCTAFNEAAPEVLGKSAGELKALQDAGDPSFEGVVSVSHRIALGLNLYASNDEHVDLLCTVKIPKIFKEGFAT